VIKKFLKRIIFGTETFRRLSLAYSNEHFLFPSAFTGASPEKLRESMSLPASQHVTQLNQDIFALLMNQFKKGFFLEIGANDGFTLSNTVYLEEKFGWSGLLVEANPKYRDSLGGRKAKSLIVAITEKNGNYNFTDAGLYGGVTEYLDKTHARMTRDATTISVQGITLRHLLEDNNSPRVINFVSIDVEGAEVPIVEQMCHLQDYRFVCGCIEHNNRSEDYKKISLLLNNAGYRIVWEGQTAHDLFFVDERCFD
jgi:FkbM family methyltransferase